MSPAPFLPVTVLLCLALPGAALALVPPGARVTDFAVEDPEGKAVRMDAFAPGGVLVLYEDRTAAELNGGLKKRLTELAREKALPAGFAVLPVADLRVFRAWPARPIAQEQLRKRSKALGRTIHADWTGAAAKALDASPRTSSVVLLDADRNVKWSGSGKVEGEALDALLDLVRALPPARRGKGPKPGAAKARAAETEPPARDPGSPPMPPPPPFVPLPPPPPPGAAVAAGEEAAEAAADAAEAAAEAAEEAAEAGAEAAREAAAAAREAATVAKEAAAVAREAAAAVVPGPAAPAAGDAGPGPATAESPVPDAAPEVADPAPVPAAPAPGAADPGPAS